MMQHVVIHGKYCIELQYNNQSMVINPVIANKQLVQRINRSHVAGIVDTIHDYDIQQWAAEQHIHYYYTVDQGVCNISNWQIDMCDGALVITCHGKKVRYQHTSVQDMTPVEDISVGLFDFSQGADSSLELTKVICPEIAVPINTVSADDDPIAYCRHVMMEQIAVPKYLKPGQHVVVES